MAISRIILPNGKTYDMEDEGDYYIYSTADFQSGSTESEVVLFQYVEGGPVARTQATSAAPERNATHRDTNIGMPGAMGDDEAMSIFSMRVHVEEATIANELAGGSDMAETFVGFQPMTTAQNAARANRWLVCELRIMGDKAYERHRIGFFNSGWGVWTYITAAATRSVANFGEPSHAGARRIAIPHLIPPTETYEVGIRNTDGKTMNWVDQTQVEQTNIQLRFNVTLLGPRMRQVGRHQPKSPPILTGEPGPAGFSVQE
jgi:hypothetical protein